MYRGHGISLRIHAVGILSLVVHVSVHRCADAAFTGEVCTYAMIFSHHTVSNNSLGDESLVFSLLGVEKNGKNLGAELMIKEVYLRTPSMDV